MKNYKIFKHQDGRIEAVKQGWSWPGFVTECFGVGFIWGLVKKLWVVAVALIIFRIVLFIISGALTPDVEYYSYNDYYEYQQALKMSLTISIVLFIVQLVVAIFIGVQGNAFREKTLLNRGYILIGTVFSVNPDMAIMEYRKEENNQTDSENNNNSNNNSSNNHTNIVV